MTLVMGLIGVAALVLLMVVGAADLVQLLTMMRRDRKGRNQKSLAGPGPARPLDPVTSARLAGLVGQGNKIQAIKDLRAATGLGLRDAKQAVDAIAAGQDISRVFPPRRDVPPDTEERARELIAQGRKVAAVKLVREEMILGLADAKALVDRLGGPGYPG